MSEDWEVPSGMPTNPAPAPTTPPPFTGFAPGPQSVPPYPGPPKKRGGRLLPFAAVAVIGALLGAGAVLLAITLLDDSEQTTADSPATSDKPQAEEEPSASNADVESGSRSGWAAPTTSPERGLSPPTNPTTSVDSEEALRRYLDQKASVKAQVCLIFEISGEVTTTDQLRLVEGLESLSVATVERVLSAKC